MLLRGEIEEVKQPAVRPPASCLRPKSPEVGHDPFRFLPSTQMDQNAAVMREDLGIFGRKFEGALENLGGFRVPFQPHVILAEGVKRADVVRLRR